MRRASAYSTFFSFVLVVLLAEFTARLVAPDVLLATGEWPRTEIAQKLQQLTNYDDEDRDVDVLFVGSSMMASGIDPVIFTRESGEFSYNGGFAGPSMRTVALWTVDVVYPLVSPDAVVVGVQSREFNDNGAKHQRMYESFVNSPGYKQAAAGVGNRIEALIEEVSDFFKYRRAFRHPSRLFDEGNDDLTGLRIRVEVGRQGNRLEEPVNYRSAEAGRARLASDVLNDFAVGGIEYRALVRLHSELKRRGVRVIVLNMPVTRDYYPTHPDPQRNMADYRSMLLRFVRATGATVIDAERAFAGPAAFRGPIHLDVEGRAALSEALGEEWRAVLSSRDRFLGMRCTSDAQPSCEVTEG